MQAMDVLDTYIEQKSGATLFTQHCLRDACTDCARNYCSLQLWAKELAAVKLMQT